MRRASLALVVCVAAAGCNQDPSILEVKPPSLDACDTIQINGVYADIQQVAVVDSANVKTPLVPGSLLRTDQAFGISGKVPLVSPGTYRVFMDQKGGNGGYFTINPGTVTSTQTFQIANTFTAPVVSLTATDAVAPGSPATLTPTISGATTTAVINPGNLSASGPRTVAACKTTTYTLTASNRCATASASATVHVPAPTVSSVAPTSVTAGGSITVTGSAFAHNTCNGTKASLVSGSSTYALGQVTTNSMTSLTAVVAPCTPPGTYTVEVSTDAGKSSNLVRLQVAAHPNPCPEDGNACTKEACGSGGVCKSTNVANGTVCPTGTCTAGKCIAPTTPPPTCVMNNGSCTAKTDCCQPANCVGLTCKACTLSGNECPDHMAGGSYCCSNVENCVLSDNGKYICKAP